MAGVPPGSADDLEYGSLVVAPGAQLAPEAVDGFDEMALDLHSTEGCGRIHAALSDFEDGVVGILVPELPFTCPAAPYEAAFLAESFLRRRGIRRNVEIHLFTPVHAPMPVAPAALGDSIADLLAARGIHWHPLFTFEELRPERREVVSSAGVHHVDLLMCIPPPSSTRGPPLVPAARALRFRPRRRADAGDRRRGCLRHRRRRDGQAPQRQGAPEGRGLRPRRGQGRGAPGRRGRRGQDLGRRVRRPWLLLDRAGRRTGRVRGRRLLRGARAEDHDQAARESAALGQVAFEKWWLHHWV